MITRMGKKKGSKKTEQLSVAIEESSTMGTEPLQQQQIPRKRGRPRKIVEKTETEEIKQEAGATESDLKKAKTANKEAQNQTEKEGELPKEAPRKRSRRKSKPHKSS